MVQQIKIVSPCLSTQAATEGTRSINTTKVPVHCTSVTDDVFSVLKYSRIHPRSTQRCIRHSWFVSVLNPRYLAGMYVQLYKATRPGLRFSSQTCYWLSRSLFSSVPSEHQKSISNNHDPLIKAYLFPIKQHNLRRQTPNFFFKKKRYQQTTQKLEATSKLKVPNGRNEASPVAYWGPTTGATVQNSAARAILVLHYKFLWRWFSPLCWTNPWNGIPLEKLKVAQLTKKLCLQWNLNFQCNIHRNPPRDHILVHIYPDHTLTPHSISISLRQLCLGPTVHVYRVPGRRVTKYCMMEPNISGSSGWNLLHANFEVNPRFFRKIYAPLPHSQSPSRSRFPTDMCLFLALTRGAISQRRFQPQRCESLKFRRNKPYISLEVLTKTNKTVLRSGSLKMGTLHYSRTLVPTCYYAKS